MRVVIASDGAGLDAQASPLFGRCQTYIFVDTDNMAFEVVDNPAIGAPSGAGIQAAQLVAAYGAQAVITGNVGPNALGVFRSAGVPVYLFGGGTVREAVEAFNAGALGPVDQAIAQAGLGRGARASLSSGTGMGYGRGGGRGMGRGRGRGMGRGQRMGRGRGRGMGMGIGTRVATPTPSFGPSPPIPGPLREGEIASLRAMAQDLRTQLAAILDQLDRLDKDK